MYSFVYKIVNLGLAQYLKFKKKGKKDSLTIDNAGKPISVDGTSIKLAKRCKSSNNEKYYVK